MTRLVAIGTSSFGEANSDAVELLKSKGFALRRNTLGRPLGAHEVVPFLLGAEGLLAGLEPLTREVLCSVPGLRAIARVGAGLDNVNQEAAAQLGIAVSSTPDAPADAVAELTMAAMLALSRDLVASNALVHRGEWRKSVCRGLRDAHVLVVGFGRIGRRVAAHCAGFGAVVRGVDPALQSGEVVAGATLTTLEEGLTWADVITLHASGAQVILGRPQMALLRRRPYVLNAARAGLVDAEALAWALDEQRVEGAWLDVFWQEPYAGPLLGHPRVLMTPHAGSYTMGCRARMEMEAAQNLLRDLDVA